MIHRFPQLEPRSINLDAIDLHPHLYQPLSTDNHRPPPLPVERSKAVSLYLYARCIAAKLTSLPPPSIKLDAIDLHSNRLHPPPLPVKESSFCRESVSLSLSSRPKLTSVHPPHRPRRYRSNPKSTNPISTSTSTSTYRPTSALFSTQRPTPKLQPRRHQPRSI